MFFTKNENQNDNSEDNDYEMTTVAKTRTWIKTEKHIDIGDHLELKKKAIKGIDKWSK